ncbi:hypothetical protein OAO01_00785 [Oligoflexia bacterium]|nr:hypothetical protein [Oligoflexia bacterium]
MASPISDFFDVAQELEQAGLLWQPEIGDEVSDRVRRNVVSVLVDTQGLVPNELREIYVWLPTIEQMIEQCEMRQAILFHAGLDLDDASLCYKIIIQANGSACTGTASTLRQAMGLGLRELLLANCYQAETLH